MKPREYRYHKFRRFMKDPVSKMIEYVCGIKKTISTLTKDNHL